MWILCVTLCNLFVALLSLGVEGTNIGTSQDDTCSKSLNNYNGPNGYPDGTCTPLHLASNQSFQVVGLDPGCAVTIYGSNSEEGTPCSSDVKIVAQLAECYNSSWIYYSIDGCNIPSTIPSSSATPSPSPTPTPSSTLVTTSSAAPTSSVLAATTSAPPAAAHTSNHTGVIVGGIVGGVFALVFATTLLFLYRRSKSLKPFELPYDGSVRFELSNSEKVANIELYAHNASEIGRNSIYIPPAELPGDSLVGIDKKGINPLIKLHRVP